MTTKRRKLKRAPIKINFLPEIKSFILSHFKEIFAVIFFLSVNDAKIAEGIKWELYINSGYEIGQVPRNTEELYLAQVLGDFIKDAATHEVAANLKDVTFTFEDRLDSIPSDQPLENEKVGLCYTQRKHIVLSKQFITPHSMQEFKATVYHEIGHCLYGLEHVDRVTNFHPYPLMFKSATNWDNEIRANEYAWDWSVMDFFSSIKNKPKPKTYVERLSLTWKKRGQRLLSLWQSFVIWTGISRT